MCIIQQGEQIFQDGSSRRSREVRPCVRGTPFNPCTNSPIYTMSADYPMESTAPHQGQAVPAVMTVKPKAKNKLEPFGLCWNLSSKKFKPKRTTIAARPSSNLRRSYSVPASSKVIYGYEPNLAPQFVPQTLGAQPAPQPVHQPIGLQRLHHPPPPPPVPFMPDIRPIRPQEPRPKVVKIEPSSRPERPYTEQASMPPVRDSGPVRPRVIIQEPGSPMNLHRSNTAHVAFRIHHRRDRPPPPKPTSPRHRPQPRNPTGAAAAVLLVPTVRPTRLEIIDAKIVELESELRNTRLRLAREMTLRRLEERIAQLRSDRDAIRRLDKEHQAQTATRAERMARDALRGPPVIKQQPRALRREVRMVDERGRAFETAQTGDDRTHGSAIRRESRSWYDRADESKRRLDRSRRASMDSRDQLWKSFASRRSRSRRRGEVEDDLERRRDSPERKEGRSRGIKIHESYGELRGRASETARPDMQCYGRRRRSRSRSRRRERPPATIRGWDAVRSAENISHRRLRGGNERISFDDERRGTGGRNI